MRLPAFPPCSSLAATSTLNPDHHLYHRQPVPLVPPFRYDAGTPFSFLVAHTLSRCRPFGVFDVYVVTRAQQRQHVGAQLSYPSHDDCWRLLREARTRALQVQKPHRSGLAVLAHTTRG